MICLLPPGEAGGRAGGDAVERVAFGVADQANDFVEGVDDPGRVQGLADSLSQSGRGRWPGAGSQAGLMKVLDVFQ